jgi:hypothetical protein
MSNRRSNDDPLPFIIILAFILFGIWLVIKSIATSIGGDPTATGKALLISAAALGITGWLAIIRKISARTALLAFITASFAGARDLLITIANDGRSITEIESYGAVVTWYSSYWMQSIVLCALVVATIWSFWDEQGH